MNKTIIPLWWSLILASSLKHIDIVVRPVKNRQTFRISSTTIPKKTENCMEKLSQEIIANIYTESQFMPGDTDRSLVNIAQL